MTHSISMVLFSNNTITITNEDGTINITPDAIPQPILTRLHIALTALADHIEALEEADSLAPKPDREPDRLAVVVNARRQAAARHMHYDGWHEEDWEKVEHAAAYYGFPGPFTRNIVECYLPRPQAPVTVKGKVTDG